MLNIEVTHNGDGLTICAPVGELDAFTVSQFRQSLAELAFSPRLLIDMSGVPFVDSAGLGALIGGIRRTRELGGSVAVVCNRPTLTRLLRKTGFDRIVTIADSVKEAAAAFQPPRQPECWLGPGRPHVSYGVVRPPNRIVAQTVLYDR